MPRITQHNIQTVAHLAAFFAVSVPLASTAQAQTAPPPAAAGQAPVAAPPSAPSAVAVYTIPEGTPITVTLQKEQKSGTAKEGDTVPFQVEKDVVGTNGQTYVKAGTPAFGRVLHSSPHGFIGKPGKLEFTCDYVLMPSGGHLALRAASTTKYGQNNTTASVAAAVVLTPVALLLPGKDTTARAGQEFTLYTDQSATVAADGTLTTTATASSASLSATGRSAFQLNDGTTVVGAISTFDGKTYSLTTDSGARQVAASDVKSISPVKQ